MLSIGPQRLKELQDAVQQRRREFLEQVPEGAPGAVGLFKDPPHGVGLHGFFKDQGLDPEDYPAGTARAEKLFEEAVADPEQQAVCYMAYIPAENEGRLRAGILLATASRMPTSGRMCAYIVYIYVLEEYRRGGVGCALMRALYDKCEHGGSRERRVGLDSGCGGGLPQTVHQAQPTGPLLSRVRLAHGVWRRPQASTAPRAVRRGLHRRR